MPYADPEICKKYQKEYRQRNRKTLYKQQITWRKHHPEQTARHNEVKRNNQIERFYIKFYALKAKPCMDCGGSFPPCAMDFDHRPDEVKLFGVGQAVCRSWKKVLAEIAKCDLICANCHRIRTKERRTGAGKPIPKMSEEMTI